MNKILDWRPKFDEQSRMYNISDVVTTTTLKTNSWACSTYLNQGNEGACVGFGWSHELAAKPVPIPNINNKFAKDVYTKAKKIDEWPGEEYSGTSVLAGAKVIKSMNYIKEYRWAFNIDDVLATLSNFGPVVIGIPWYEGMYETNSRGFIAPNGRLISGHCILARGIATKYEYVTLRNSWGYEWGRNGDCKLKFSDLEALLNDDGECCVPVVRKYNV